MIHMKNDTWDDWYKDKPLISIPQKKSKFQGDCMLSPFGRPHVEFLFWSRAGWWHPCWPGCLRMDGFPS